MATPGRASFAGTPAKASPSFGDFAKSLLDREKTFKQAPLVAVANLITIFILATCYAIHVVLQPFVRPLLLSLLFGSFLFPLKKTVAKFLSAVISKIKNDKFPLLKGLVMPFIIIDRTSTKLQEYFYQYGGNLVSFSQTLLEGDVISIGSVTVAGISLGIIGGDRLMNFLLCANLIIFLTQVTKTNVSFSDAYLHFLIRSFGLAQFCWLCPQILYLLIPIGLAYIMLKLLFKKVKDNLLQPAFGHISDTISDESNGADEYDDQSLPLPSINEVFKKFLDILDGYVDAISTICVIALVALIISFMTIYLSFQIYSEGLYLVERLSLSINSILDNNPDLRQLLPDSITGVQGLLDGAVNNTYQHGREWIMKSTRQLISNAALDDFNSTQSVILEKQMVEFWDRAYVLWLKNRNGTHIDDIHLPYDWNRLLEALKTLNFALISEVFKQNYETLTSVLDSVSKVLKGNLSLVLGMLTALFSLVMVGGNVLVNFSINLIIFTTALFNLLCASGDQYKPIELIKAWAPPSRLLRRPSRSNDLWNYVDESINKVFTASLKTMAFQGLSTWLLHRIFQLQVVYIPSVISMVFGAVPFISPYWSSIPAVIDLCWSEHWSQGLLMLVLATVPSSFVTSTFYSEIKGAGDPYLTGLAIAGGVFVFGIEGALFGPMLLVTMKLIYLVVHHYSGIYV